MASEGKIPNKMIFDNPQKEVTTITGLKNREKAEMTISVKKRNVEEIKGIKEGNNIVFIIPNEGDSKNEKIRVIKSLAGLSNSRISNKNLMRRRRNRREIVMGETPFTEKQIEGAKVVKIAKNEAEKTNYIVTYNEKNNTIKKVYKTKLSPRANYYAELPLNIAINSETINSTATIIDYKNWIKQEHYFEWMCAGGPTGGGNHRGHLGIYNVYIADGITLDFLKAIKVEGVDLPYREHLISIHYPDDYSFHTTSSIADVLLEEMVRVYGSSTSSIKGGIYKMNDYWDYRFEDHMNAQVIFSGDIFRYDLLTRSSYILVYRSPMTASVDIDVKNVMDYGDGQHSWTTIKAQGVELDKKLGYKIQEGGIFEATGNPGIKMNGYRMVFSNDLIESGKTYNIEMLWKVRESSKVFCYDMYCGANQDVMYAYSRYINGTSSSGGDKITINFIGKKRLDFEIDDPKNELFDFGKIIQGHKKYIDKVIKIKNLKSKKVVNVKFEKNMMDIPKVDDASKTLKVTGDISIIKKGEMKEIPIKVKMIAEATDTQEIGQYKGEVKIIIDIE